MPTRILLADDHPVLRTGLISLINEHPDLEVVAEAGNGDELMEAVAAQHPDVLILDIRMPNFDPVATTQHLTATCPGLRILILTAHDDEDYIHGLLDAGALGYVIKDEAPTDLIAAIRSVARGELWLSARVAHRVARRALGYAAADEAGPLANLTDREREILALIGAGFSNREIAHRLVIAEKTVENHIHNLYHKLNLNNRPQAVRFAIHHGLVQPGDHLF
jgi:DNA-binding NarL/FixJ family response regulator